MALGKVSIDTATVAIPTFSQPEGVGLFLGEVTSGDGVLKAIGRETDLVALFGVALDLVDTLESARENGGPNWKAWAIGHTNLQAWDDVIPLALPGCDPEFLVICKPVTAGSELTDIQTELAIQLALHKRLFAIAAFRGYLTVTDADWSAYLVAAAAITNAIDAGRVLVVPQVFGNELGAYAGRLQKVIDERTPKISRSPMRVRSGGVVNPGALAADLLDDLDAVLQLSHLETLDGDRFSVFQWYAGREGIYFADGNLLVPSGSSEPAVIEYLRLLDKAARRLRTIAIDSIGDDEVVNTPAGNAAFGTRLSAPLRQMVALGEIKPLARDAIVVTWTAVDKVKVKFTVQPPNSPKEITGEITLETTQGV